MLWRMPAATVRWPCGVASLYCGPTSNSAGSDRPRASLRDAASIRLGRIEGRIVSSVASIEFSRRRSGWPPPKRSALLARQEGPGDGLVHAARGQRPAGLRHAALHRVAHRLRRRSTAAAARWSGIWSKPNTRVTSSTRSASPTMSGRHDGTAAVHGPLPLDLEAELASGWRRCRRRARRCRSESSRDRGAACSCAARSASRRSTRSRCTRRRTVRGSGASRPRRPTSSDCGSMPRSKR